MEETPKHDNPLWEPVKALRNALTNLEQFIGSNREAPSPHVADLTVKEGQLVSRDSSLLQKALSLLAALFSSHARKNLQQQKEHVQHAVLDAIHTIKRNHLIIDKLKQGNPEERQLASDTLATLKRYNGVLASKDKIPKEWTKRLEHFIHEKSGLAVDEELHTQHTELPATTSLPVHQEVLLPSFHAGVLTPSSHHATDPLLQQEADLIRMKASTLLRQHGLYFATPAATVTSIKNAKIQGALDRSSNTSMLCLTLEVLPGTTIKVQGSFRRDAASETRSMPISESFQLSLNSTQTGFPYSSQRNGEALTDVLIPTFPLHLEEMPLFKPLYERKRRATTELAPGGVKLELAKQLIDVKRRAFDADSLYLHQQRSLTLVKAAPHPQPTDAVTAYYISISTHPACYDYLAETHDAINAHFIVAPFAALQKAWLNRSVPELFGSGAAAVTQAAFELLNQELERAKLHLRTASANAQSDLERHTFAYIEMIGSILGSAAQPIMLQHLSETLCCAPPMLNDFEQTTQAIAYLQLQQFLDELDSPLPDVATMCNTMKQQLETEIAWYNHSTFEALQHPIVELVEELEGYFNTRFYLKG